jgi:uracil-DNA glycosylase
VKQKHLYNMDRATLTQVFDGLGEEYKQLLARNNKQLLSPILTKLDEKIKAGEEITPPPADIFRAFKLTTWNNLRVVIIGQDPFIRPQQATGLSFSVPKSVINNAGKRVEFKIPPSTRKIYNCLLNCGMISEMPSHGNLEEWAKQGVLMLNAALTTEMGESNAHTFWHSYTDKIIQDLSERKDFIVFVLWGNFAQEKAALIDDTKHIVLKWGHPSPMNSANKSAVNKQNFLYCDSFTRTNEELDKRGLPIINWNVNIADPHNAQLDPVPVQQPTEPNCAYLFTDGGATANGKANCKATWGAYVVIKGRGATTHTMSGIVAPVKIKGGKFQTSNNRGEITALVEAIKYIRKLKYPYEIEIISDSKYLIDCITKWIPNWLRDDKTAEKKNTDLLIPLYTDIKKMDNEITFKHINSHRRAPPEESPEYFYWYGNDIADKLCAKLLE